MRSYRLSSAHPHARVLCVSCRDIAPVMSRCLPYEFEDLIAELDAVDVIVPADIVGPVHTDGPLRVGVRTMARLAAKTARRVAVKAEGRFPALGRRVPPQALSHDYDVLFVNTEAAADLYTLAPLTVLRSKARLSMCYVGEMYAADVAGLGDLLPLLKQFDHILVAVRGTVQALEEATGRPCHYLPPSTDTAKFCPYPDPPHRVIDFYAMGRRAPATHDALLHKAAKDDWYYMYDTTPNSIVTSHVEHRQRLADMMKRSRFFLVNCARFTDQQRTRGQQELGFRYFEGAAAGTVLVGDAPDNATFHEQFGWEDSVIALPADPERIDETLAALDADPARLERISRTNVVNSLRRHDHVYRWAQVLSLAGLEISPAMTNRVAELHELADTIEDGITAALSPSEAPAGR